MADRITYVGLYVHKEKHPRRDGCGRLRGEVREYGRIANTRALDRLVRKLGGAGVTLRFCCEAGPCGYGIQRRLSVRGHPCVVSLLRRRRWSAEEKATIVQETYAPGMSVSLVPRRHGIAPNRLFRWRRLDAEGALSAVAPAPEYRACRARCARCSGGSARTGRA